MRAIASACLRAVRIEGDIPHVVEAVFDLPVPANILGQDRAGSGLRAAAGQGYFRFKLFRRVTGLCRGPGRPAHNIEIRSPKREHGGIRGWSGSTRGDKRLVAEFPQDDGGRSIW